MSVTVLGIRHHGPGSARSLRAALERLQPDAILVEGPPEADHLIPYVGHADMAPPVALLVYHPAEPSRSVFYPFAVFSPEWQAMRYGVSLDVPVRCIDLGYGQLRGSRRRIDPLQALAEAAGYDDAERWWEHLVEERRDTIGIFEAILQAMSVLRPDPLETDEVELAREAMMRQRIRQAARDGFERIAVVCGAWHAPALAASIPASRDAARLKGLPRLKALATWVPWTYGRLTLESGYGAGVHSPGWYHHLWEHPDDLAEVWLSQVAGLLRDEDLETSPAQTVDAVRLALALSALRHRPRPGLAEMNDAADAVLCSGATVPLHLIRDRLVVGERLGRVPDDTPQVALAQDLARLQKRLRLPPQATPRDVDLDLRTDTDRQRSMVLRQLNLLGVRWGRPQEAEGKLGTFHEYWRLRWDPDMAVAVVQASIWGNTVAQAAAASVQERLSNIGDLPQLTRLLHDLLLAGLADAMPVALQRLEELSALTEDVLVLMQAAPALARLVRYGNVRGTDTGSAATVVEGLLERIYIGLPPASEGLSPESALVMVAAIREMDEAVGLLDIDPGPWQSALATLSQIAPGLVAGGASGLLVDRGFWDSGEARRRLGLALSARIEPRAVAGWVEGFLQGRGTLMVHDHRLRELLDGWVSTLAKDVFVELLPLLRRTFATFTEAERRRLGETLAGPVESLGQEVWDSEAVARALPLLQRLYP